MLGVICSESRPCDDNRGRSIERNTISHDAEHRADCRYQGSEAKAKAKAKAKAIARAESRQRQNKNRAETEPKPKLK